HLRLCLCFLWLARGDVARVRAELAAHPAPARAHDLSVPDALAIWIGVHLLLYEGKVEAAAAELAARAPLLDSAGYSRFDPGAAGFRLLRATLELACLRVRGDGAAIVRVERCARSMRRAKRRFADAAAALAEAGALHARGDVAAAATAYRTAASAFE